MELVNITQSVLMGSAAETRKVSFSDARQSMRIDARIGKKKGVMRSV